MPRSNWREIPAFAGMTSSHQQINKSSNHYLRFMNFRLHIFLLLGVLLIPVAGLTQLVKVASFAPRRADTVIVERNWRTREKIILAELEFHQGDTVNPENLEKSLKKIWN